MISYTTFCFNFLGFPHCLGVIQSLWGTEPTLLWRPSCGSQLFTYVGDWTLTITPRNVHLAVPVSDSKKLRQWNQLLSPWLRLSPSLGDDQALKQNFTILTKAYLGAFEDFACEESSGWLLSQHWAAFLQETSSSDPWLLPQRAAFPEKPEGGPWGGPWHPALFSLASHSLHPAPPRSSSLCPPFSQYTGHFKAQSERLPEATWVKEGEHSWPPLWQKLGSRVASGLHLCGDAVLWWWPGFFPTVDRHFWYDSLFIHKLKILH